MNVKKYPETDPQFYEKVRGACRNDYELGLVFILQHTGAHISCLVTTDSKKKMRLKGDYLYWRRPKNDKPMRSRIPKGDREIIVSWLRTIPGNRTERALQFKIKTIGDRAGFPDLSPMSFRVQYGCKRLDDGKPPHEVCHLLGCNLSTLMNNYAQLNEAREVEEAEDNGNLD